MDKQKNIVHKFLIRICFFIPNKQEEFIIGDLEEKYKINIKYYGKKKAVFFYLFEIFKSTPSFFVLSLINKRRLIMKLTKLLEQNNKNAILSTVLLIPALMIFIPGVLYTVFGMNSANDFLDTVIANNGLIGLVYRFCINPFVIFSGLLAACVINFVSSIHFDFHFNTNVLSSNIIFKGKALNLMIICTCIFLASMMVLYAFVENFEIVMR